MANRKKTYIIRQNNKKVFEFTVVIPESGTYTDFQWDSKTGLVTALYNGSRIPVETIGITTGTLEPMEFDAQNVVSMDYNYWYY